MCAACRQRRSADDLIRLVRDARGLARGPGAGRGVWVGPSTECLESALRRGAIARGLRAEVNGDEVARIMVSWPTEFPACPYGGP